MLAVDQAAEVPRALRSLTVLAGNLDHALDTAQLGTLLALAGSVCAEGHLRLVGEVGEVGEAAAAREVRGVTVVDLVR